MMVTRIRRSALGLVLPAALLLLWIWAAGSGRFGESQLPSPSSIISVVGELDRRDELWSNISASLKRVLLGYGIGAGVGILLGAIIGLSKSAFRLLSPTLQAIRAVPSLAWVPLLILWMGIYESPKITLIAIGAFFPVLTTVVSGFHHVPKSLVEVGRAYSLRSVAIVTRIYIPAASPQIFSGLRLGLAQAWLFLVAAELIASSAGLGFLLIDSQNISRTDIVFFAIILLALLGKGSDMVLARVEKRALAWSR
jgi:sulfonate transport system permease protein